MNRVFELTRSLVNIESISNNETQVASFLFDHLSRIAAHSGGHVERMLVEGERFNVFAFWAIQPSRFPRAWIRCRRFFRPARMTAGFGDADRVTRKASSLQWSEQPTNCPLGTRGILVFCFWWVRSAIAPERKSRPKILRARAIW